LEIKEKKLNKTKLETSKQKSKQKNKTYELKKFQNNYLRNLIQLMLQVPKLAHGKKAEGRHHLKKQTIATQGKERELSSCNTR